MDCNPNNETESSDATFPPAITHWPAHVRFWLVAIRMLWLGTDGGVTYVTEGMLRALHRASVSESPPYRDVVPVRVYDRQSGKPLVPGEIAELTFDLLPISYLFKPGHSIRLSIAGSDKDHFSDTRKLASNVQVFRNVNYRSRIVLPTMPSSVVGLH